MRQAYRPKPEDLVTNVHASGLVLHLLLPGALILAGTVSVLRVDVAPLAAAPRLLAVAATTLLTRMIGVIMTDAEIDPAALMIGSYS